MTVATWFLLVTSVVDGGKTYDVVFVDGTSINPGCRLAKEPSYPGIADDYRRTARVLEGLRPDIWLAAHTGMFSFDAKREAAAKAGPAAWVDRAGYRRFIATLREKLASLDPTGESP